MEDTEGHRGSRMDSAAAKQFLISKVIEEAEFEHVSLSNIEKKMLYFSEVYPSLPDIYDVNAKFERDYDSDEYEAKIAGLLSNARDRDSRSYARWKQEWEDASPRTERRGPLHSGFALSRIPRISHVLIADAPFSRLHDLHRNRNRRGFCLYRDCHMEGVVR